VPRARPRPDDAVAEQFLAHAGELMDAYLAPSGSPRPPRLKAIHFPATLEWLRTEDVVRLAEESGKAGLSRKAFFNRWPTREDFVQDALVYALLYRDRPTEQLLDSSLLGRMTETASFSEGIIRVADPFLEHLLRDPRSFLMVHVGPLLEHHPTVRERSMASLRTTREWFGGYVRVMNDLGLHLRPGWDIERFGLAIQSILDGFLFRYRIQPEDFRPTRWKDASLFADTVIAFCLGVMATDRAAGDHREALDAMVRRSVSR
jgi:AcrR family transcriptional regulator